MPGLTVMRRAVDSVTPARAIVVMASCIALLGLLGIWVVLGEPPLERRLDLDREATVPAVFSGLLLIVGGALAVLLGSEHFGGRRVRHAFFCLGGFLVFMGFDELLRLHEHLHIWTGVRWQILYAPLLVVVALPALAVLRALGREGVGAREFVAGAVAWVVAQSIEILQFRGSGHESKDALLIPEEMLEMTGSALFLLALLRAARTSTGRRQETAPSRQARP